MRVCLLNMALYSILWREVYKIAYCVLSESHASQPQAAAGECPICHQEKTLQYAGNKALEQTGGKISSPGDIQTHMEKTQSNPIWV